MYQGKIIAQNWSISSRISNEVPITDFFFLVLIGGVKHTVLLQRKLFEESQPPPSCTKIKEAKKSKAQKESSALPVKGMRAGTVLWAEWEWECNWHLEEWVSRNKTQGSTEGAKCCSKSEDIIVGARF